MKVRLILTGMIAGLLVPLAAANGGTVFNPGLNQAGAGIDLARGAAPIADNYWRTVDKDDKGDHDKDCDKSPSKDQDCHKPKCDKDDPSHKCDKDDHHRKCDKNDERHNRMRHDKDGEWEDHIGKCDRDDQK